jgi:hypothetical protein
MMIDTADKVAELAVEMLPLLAINAGILAFVFALWAVSRNG